MCHSLLDFKLIFLSSISNCNFNFNPLDYLRSRKFFFFLCKNLNCHEQNSKGNFKQAYIYLIQRKIERKLTTISFSHAFKNKREKEKTQGEFCIKFILQIEIVKWMTLAMACGPWSPYFNTPFYGVENELPMECIWWVSDICYSFGQLLTWLTIGCDIWVHLSLNRWLSLALSLSLTFSFSLSLSLFLSHALLPMKHPWYSGKYPYLGKCECKNVFPSIPLFVDRFWPKERKRERKRERERKKEGEKLQIVLDVIVHAPAGCSWIDDSSTHAVPETPCDPLSYMNRSNCEFIDWRSSQKLTEN